MFVFVKCLNELAGKRIGVSVEREKKRREKIFKVKEGGLRY